MSLPVAASSAVVVPSMGTVNMASVMVCSMMMTVSVQPTSVAMALLFQTLQRLVGSVVSALCSYLIPPSSLTGLRAQLSP